MEVTVYSTPTCPFCVKTKDFLKKEKISYKEVNVLQDQQRGTAIMEKSGQTGVPQIEIKDKEKTTILVGFDKDALKKALHLP